jgi:hypothetical protein
LEIQSIQDTLTFVHRKYFNRRLILRE